MDQEIERINVPEYRMRFNRRFYFALGVGVGMVVMHKYGLKMFPTNNLYLEVTPELARRMADNGRALIFETPAGMLMLNHIAKTPENLAKLAPFAAKAGVVI